MKYLILGDIHGRLIWNEIVEKENPDITVFLGDYVTTHEGISADQQLSNLEDILNYKKDNVDSVILLRGNHDLQMLGYSWASCSGYDPKVSHYMSESSFKEYFLKLTQWIYVDDSLRIIFSHAGISQVWMDNSGIKDIHEINNLKPSELFGFIPDNYYDVCGTSKTQPPTWIRPETLCQCNILGYDQIVGHTPQSKSVSKLVLGTRALHTIWLCDSLANLHYLVIENGEFKICEL
jgi:hypothetical protein